MSIAHQVEDFLLTDALLARALGPAETGSTNTERLLLHQEDHQTLNLSLFLDQDIVDQLTEDSPVQQLHDGNLDAFWLAVEGVSHFLYLLWNVKHQRPVSCLEMELQAEVDKYYSACELFREQNTRGQEAALYQILFERVRFADGDHRQRYIRANELAARFCRQRLEQGMASDRLALQTELRRFYRLSHHHKLQCARKPLRR